jgi:IclR family transcriptional regulator, acetate operon repressor
MGRATQRSIEILELIAEANRKWTHAQIARQLAIPKSTLTDLLRDLVQRSYLEVDAAGEYLIGPSVLMLSRSYLRRMDVVSRSKDILLRLCEKSDEASSVAVRQGLEIVVVAQERPLKPFVAAMTLGDRAPLIATAVGKSILAFLGEQTIGDIIKQSAKQSFHLLKPKSQAALKAELAGIRAGALARNAEEWMEGLGAVALPILTPDGPIASIAVAAPIVRMTKKWLDAVEPQLRHAAWELSLRMGGTQGD